MILTEIVSLTCTDRHAVSIVLSEPNRLPYLRRTDWSKFQTCLEADLPSNPDLRDVVVIDACVKELSSAISKALAETTPKCHPRDESRCPIPAGIHDEIRLKTG